MILAQSIEEVQWVLCDSQDVLMGEGRVSGGQTIEKMFDGDVALTGVPCAPLGWE